MTCPVQGCVRAGEHNVHVSELATEDSGLLPTRRREHDFGENKPARFGSFVARCNAKDCEAYRLTNRDRTYVYFHQFSGAEPAEAPGPCPSWQESEVKP